MATTRRGATLKPIVRVSNRIDVARLSRAVQRPGIDPRQWETFAVVTSEPVVEDVDASSDAGGVFVNVTLVPSLTETTAFLAAEYAGDGYGFYCPVVPNDLVLVSIPDGDPNNGCVIQKRLWNPSEPPPQAAIDHPLDVCLVVRPDRSLRLKVSGGGNVAITCDNGAKVRLGDETQTKPVAREGDPVNIGSFNILGGVGQFMTGIQHIAPDGTVTNFSVTLAPPPAACSGEVSGGSDKVEAS